MTTHPPVDPDCPVIAHLLRESRFDPQIHRPGSPIDTLMIQLKSTHAARCPRCLEYRLAHAEADHG